MRNAAWVIADETSIGMNVAFGSQGAREEAPSANEETAEVRIALYGPNRTQVTVVHVQLLGEGGIPER